MVDRKLSELLLTTDGPVGTDEFYFIRSDGGSPATHESFRAPLSDLPSNPVIAADVGFSPTGLANTNATDVQEALEDLDAAIAGTVTFMLTGIIETAADADYRIAANIPFAMTITKITTRSASGTCTLTGKINTTALGGTANSVSSSEQSQSHASSNAASAGDDIVLTISSNSSALKVTTTIEYTRTLS